MAFGNPPSATPWGSRWLQGGPRRPSGPTNPWQDAMWKNYGEAQKTPYGNQWKTAVAKASRFGNKDWTGELKRFAEEDINRMRAQQANQFQAYGVGELAFAKDQTDDWAKRSHDAQIRASMQGQQMQQSALDTMRGMLSSASGVELDRIGQMIQAAGAGGGNYNDFMRILVPLMEKLGYYRG